MQRVVMCFFPLSVPPVNPIVSIHAGGCGAEGHDEVLRMDRILCSLYVHDLYWWESVLLVQRMLLTCIATLTAFVPIVRAFFATFVCVVALVR